MTSRRKRFGEIFVKEKERSPVLPRTMPSSSRLCWIFTKTGFDIRWLEFALELEKTQDKNFFSDEKNDGYFSTSGDDESVLLRMKENNNSAEPSSNSIAALNLLRLALPAGWRVGPNVGASDFQAFAPILMRAPTALPQKMCFIVDYSLGKPQQIVIAAKRASRMRKSYWTRSGVGGGCASPRRSG